MNISFPKLLLNLFKVLFAFFGQPHRDGENVSLAALVVIVPFGWRGAYTVPKVIVRNFEPALFEYLAVNVLEDLWVFSSWNIGDDPGSQASV